MAQSDLVVPLGKLSLSLAITDLSSAYEKARSKLIKGVKSTIKAFMVDLTLLISFDRSVMALQTRQQQQENVQAVKGQELM